MEKTYPGLPELLFIDSNDDAAIQELRRPDAINIIFGAALLGERTLAACRHLAIDVACFCDNDPKKKALGGIPVLKPEDAAGKYPGANIFFAITLPNPMIRQLRAMGVKKLFGIGIVRRLPGALSRPAGVGDAFGESLFINRAIWVQQGWMNYLQGRGVSLPFVESMITERCSLRCLNCANLMQYYTRPQHRSFDDVCAEIDAICDAADAIGELRLIGGEPLLHPDFHRIAVHAAAKPNVEWVNILTNGTLLLRDEQWDSLPRDKVFFTITDYGELSGKKERLLDAMRHHGVHGWMQHHSTWTRCYFPGRRNLSEETKREHYLECYSAVCLTLLDKRLYHCEYSANAHHLRAMEAHATDSIPLFPAEALRLRLADFVYGTTTLESCDYCLGIGRDGEKVPPAEQCSEPLQLPSVIR